MRLFLAAAALAAGLSPVWSSPPPQSAAESGRLLIYFMEEQVGYEDYTWSADEMGFVLQARGRMTKPVRLEVESLTLKLSRDFIPLSYAFRGAVNSIPQDIESVFGEGQVRNTIKIAGHENVQDVAVRRDTFVLPNPIFSPYLVLARKYACGLRERMEVSAYIIPQVEVTGTLEARADAPCLLFLKLAGVEVSLETEATGKLLSLTIPGQRLRVTVQ